MANVNFPQINPSSRSFVPGRYPSTDFESGTEYYVQIDDTAFDDSTGKACNLTGFQENRHDQSVWSLICKKFGVVEINERDSPISPTRIRR